MVMFALLTVLAERSLEVVIFHGQIIPVVGRLRFVEVGQFPVGIFTAVIHVKAQEIRA